MSELTQLRKGITAMININPITITTVRMPTKTDPFDATNTIPDPFGTPVTVSIKCRVSHEEKGAFIVTETNAGMSTNLGRFIISDYQNVLQENMTFTELGKKWRVGAVDPLIKFSDIIGYQAPLYEAK
ncbi:MAG: hypothetical protein OEV44_01365 [Spirochaetota bacterium]|nr:hypothetical protein [Spirochaetota bacterium]